MTPARRVFMVHDRSTDQPMGLGPFATRAIAEAHMDRIGSGPMAQKFFPSWRELFYIEETEVVDWLPGDRPEPTS